MGLLDKAKGKIVKEVVKKTAFNAIGNYMDSHYSEKAQLDKTVFDYVLFIRGMEVYDERDNHVYTIKKPLFSYDHTFYSYVGTHKEIGKIEAERDRFFGEHTIKLTVDGQDYGELENQVDKFKINGLGWRCEPLRFLSSTYIIYDKKDNMIIRYLESNQNTIVVEYVDKAYEHFAVILAMVNGVYSSMIK